MAKQSLGSRVQSCPHSAYFQPTGQPQLFLSISSVYWKLEKSSIDFSCTLSLVQTHTLSNAHPLSHFQTYFKSKETHCGHNPHKLIKYITTIYLLLQHTLYVHVMGLTKSKWACLALNLYSIVFGSAFEWSVGCCFLPSQLVEPNLETTWVVKQGENHPKVKEGENLPKVKDGETHPRVQDEEYPPKVKDEENPPKVKDGEAHPKGKDEENPPKVKDGEAHPKGKDGEAHPKGKDEENPPALSTCTTIASVNCPCQGSLKPVPL